jgi:acetyltransferase
VFSFLSAFYENQRQLMQTPGPLSQQAEPDVEGARLIIESALAHGRHLLNEVESKALLSAFRIPIAQTLIARDPMEAMLMAQQMGFPVVMKINSPDITHKSDVNGVRLGLSSGQAVRSAFGEMLADIKRLRPDAILDGIVVEPMVTRPHAREVLLGMTSDPVLGPVIVFGAGGVDVEALQDRAVTLPPLNRYLARDLIRRTRAANCSAHSATARRSTWMRWRMCCCGCRKWSANCRGWRNSTSIRCWWTSTARWRWMPASSLPRACRWRTATATWRSIPIRRIW